MDKLEKEKILERVKELTEFRLEWQIDKKRFPTFFWVRI